MALYLCGLACRPGAEAAFAARWTAEGRRLDMGRACLRFRKLEDLDLALVAEAIAAVPCRDFAGL